MAKKLGAFISTCIRAQENKSFNAAPSVTGVSDRQLPEARLNGNFAGGSDASDPGLMQLLGCCHVLHGSADMMHTVLGSRQQSAGASSFNIESDFVEAPSQMLEEFFRSSASSTNL